MGSKRIALGFLCVNKLCPMILAACMAALTLCGGVFAQGQVTAEVKADRENIYANEIFYLTISFDATGINMGKDIGLSSLPDREWLTLGEFKELEPERRMVDNQVREFRRFRCSARAPIARQVVVEPVLRIRVVSRQQMFIGFGWVETPMDLRPKPLTLNMLPIPENGRPDDYSGAIGQLDFNVEVTPTDVAAGDLVTLKMTIRGDGYFDKMIPPRLGGGVNLRTYDPRLAQGGEGETVFEQVVVPQNTNATTLAAVSFSYFDPRAGSYKTIVKGPFQLTFHPQKTLTFEQYRPKQESGTNAATVTGAVAGVEVGKADAASAGGRGKGLFGSLFGARDRAVALKNESAMFAPSQSSTSTFEVPRNAEVRVFSRHGSWVKIGLGGKRGWIPASSVK